MSQVTRAPNLSMREASAIGDLLKAPKEAVTLTNERIEFFKDVVQDYPELFEDTYKNKYPMPK